MNPFQLRNRLKALRNIAQRGNNTEFLELSIKTRKQLKQEPTDTNVRISNHLTNAENIMSRNERIEHIDKAIKEIK